MLKVQSFLHECGEHLEKDADFQMVAVLGIAMVTMGEDIGSEMAGIEDAQFKGQILLQCDRTLPFSLIREVMYTAGQAQFGEFRFVVIKTAG